MRIAASFFLHYRILDNYRLFQRNMAPAGGAYDYRMIGIGSRIFFRVMPRDVFDGGADLG
jgi:hypothetical protein